MIEKKRWQDFEPWRPFFWSSRLPIGIYLRSERRPALFPSGNQVDEEIYFAILLSPDVKPGTLRRNRSGCDNRNHAAACDFWSLLGSRDGAASPRKAASCAAVRYSQTLRCCCFNVATTVIMLATKREPSSL